MPGFKPEPGNYVLTLYVQEAGATGEPLAFVVTPITLARAPQPLRMLADAVLTDADLRSACFETLRHMVSERAALTEPEPKPEPAPEPTQGMTGADREH